jgi:UDPglucose--hexose-1-phosphate uridylyltransferase
VPDADDAREQTAELRHAVLSGAATIVAPGRQSRPKDTAAAESVPACPFCPGNEQQTPPTILELPRSPGEPDWFVRVVANSYPIVSGESSDGAPPAGGLLPLAPATGVHEVIIETPRHDQEMWQLSEDELLLTLQAYRERMSALLATPSVRQIVIFKNRGAEAGTSLEHPHSQLLGLTTVPDETRRRIARARRYFRSNGRCLVCDLLNEEKQDGRRIVFEEDGFVALAPFAAGQFSALRLAPIDHSPAFDGSDDAALRHLSRGMLSLLRRFSLVFEDAPYNLVLRTWPRPWHQDEPAHWYLDLYPRAFIFGGFELATGIIVNSLAPEEVAARLRDA